MIRIALAAAALSIVAAPAIAQEPDAAKGKELYDLQCNFCHNDDTMGPTLTGVHGRKIASGGFEYSDSLKAKKEEPWTDAHLDAFLKSPNEFAPGTKMQMAVTDDANRAAIIAYLKTLK
jgi:cytochrome c